VQLFLRSAQLGVPQSGMRDHQKESLDFEALSSKILK
jgi:hypothetical protein